MASISPEDAEDPREVLRALGARRQAQEDTDAALSEEIRQALAATDGIVSKTEAATLLKMHRTTLYRVYGD